MPVPHTCSAPVTICIRGRAKHWFYISLYQLDFTWLSGLIEIRLQRAIEAQDSVSILAEYGLGYP